MRETIKIRCIVDFFNVVLKILKSIFSHSVCQKKLGGYVIRTCLR